MKEICNFKDETSFTVYIVSQFLWITSGISNELVLIRNELSASPVSSGTVSKNHMGTSSVRQSANAIDDMVHDTNCF